MVAVEISSPAIPLKVPQRVLHSGQALAAGQATSSQSAGWHRSADACSQSTGAYPLTRRLFHTRKLHVHQPIHRHRARDSDKEQRKRHHGAFARSTREGEHEADDAQAQLEAGPRSQSGETFAGHFPSPAAYCRLIVLLLSINQPSLSFLCFCFYFFLSHSCGFDCRPSYCWNRRCFFYLPSFHFFV